MRAAGTAVGLRSCQAAGAYSSPCRPAPRRGCPHRSLPPTMAVRMTRHLARWRLPAQLAASMAAALKLVHCPGSRGLACALRWPSLQRSSLQLRRRLPGPGGRLRAPDTRWHPPGARSQGLARGGMAEAGGAWEGLGGESCIQAGSAQPASLHSGGLDCLLAYLDVCADARWRLTLLQHFQHLHFGTVNLAWSGCASPEGMLWTAPGQHPAGARRTSIYDGCAGVGAGEAPLAAGRRASLKGVPPFPLDMAACLAPPSWPAVAAVTAEDAGAEGPGPAQPTILQQHRPCEGRAVVVRLAHR